METKRLCILSMSNGSEVMGDLVATDEPDWARLERPCVLQMQAPNNLVLRDMLRGNQALSGDSVMVNLRAVMWIVEPSRELLSAYQAQRAGLLVANSAVVGVNQ